MACGLIAFALSGLLGCSLHSWELTRAPTLFKNTVGSVTVGKLKAGGAGVQIDVYHLAAPQEVAPGSTSFVAWLRPRTGGALEKLGKLDPRPEGDMPGSTFTLTASTPHAQADFDIFITPETDAGATLPGHQRLLWASVGSR